MRLVNGDGMEWEPAPPEHFTGAAWFGHHHTPTHPEDLDVLGVRFEPGARTDWHTHPGGQVIYVLEGTAFVQTDGGELVQAGPGDAVHAPAGELHWHGSASDTPMRHLSITYGGATEWSDRKVTDEEYPNS
jgi:quercetin dioxygenase-like cupin family protein